MFTEEVYRTLTTYYLTLKYSIIKAKKSGITEYEKGSSFQIIFECYNDLKEVIKDKVVKEGENYYLDGKQIPINMEEIKRKSKLDDGTANQARQYLQNVSNRKIL